MPLSVKGRYAVSFGGRIVGALLQAVVIALLARSLGVSGFGQFAMVSSVFLFMISVTELGTGTAVLRVSADDDRSGLLTMVGLWRMSTSVLILTAGLGLSVALSLSSLELAVAVGLYCTGEALGDLGVGVLQGHRKSGLATGLLVGRRAFPVVVMLAWPTESGALTALTATGVVGFVALGATLVGSVGKPASLLRFIRQKAGIIITTGSRSISQLDVLLVGSIGGVELAALYGAAARLMTPANLAITTLTQVLIPELSAQRVAAQRLQTFRRARRPVTIAAAAVGASALAAPWIVRIIFGADFAAAAPIVGGVLIGAGLTAVSQFHMSWFYATYVPRSVVVGTVVIILVGLGLVAGLGHWLGVWGCAVAVALWRLLALANILSAWTRSTRPEKRTHPRHRRTA